MCGIFGSFNQSTFEVLYDSNKKRGNFAFGAIMVHHNTLYAMDKKEGEYDNLDHFVEDAYKLFLGHTQAPTSVERDWSNDTSHPFENGDWVVAHNGVLTNYKDLNSKYVPWNVNRVDSACIPAMLQEEWNNDNEIDEVDLICRVLGRLEGTAGLWIYNSRTSNTYLYRQGSTIFANMLTGDFSSVRGNNYVPLEQGALYSLTSEGIVRQRTVDGFKSPFFTL